MKQLSYFSLFVIIFIILNYESIAQSLVSPGGNHLVDGGLTITVDPYGAFGSAAAPAGDAIFNAPGSLGYAATTYESAVFLRMPGFSSFLSRGLIGSSGNMPDINFTSISGNEVRSLFFVNGLTITLIQNVTDRIENGIKVGSTLNQTYLIQNNTTTQVNFEMVRYLDGDLYFSGGFSNDWGGENNLTLFEFDSGSNPANPTTYLGIKTFGGINNYANGFEVDQYSGLLNNIIGGIPLDNTVYGDSNHDGLTDFPYDITLALQRNYSLNPGQSTYFLTVTEFGMGEIEQTPIQNIAKESINTITWGVMYVSGIPLPIPLETAYDIEFANQELLIYLNIKLIGADPGDLPSVWKQGIEGIWSDRYDIVDGIYKYPLKIKVNWVNENENHNVFVIKGSGRPMMYVWYTINDGYPTNMADEIAAHEAGHMLGQYDEYCEPFTDQNGDGIYNWGEPFTDEYLPRNSLWDSGTLNPITWLNNTGSLMDEPSGPTTELHYKDMLAWLVDKSNRNLELAYSPLPRYLQDTSSVPFYDPQFIDVDFDIKPQSCPNPLNVNSNGVIPVAILGTTDFNVNSIDPSSVRFEGISPTRWAFEDVSGPLEINNSCECNEEIGDGLMDMTFKFSTQELAHALGAVNDGDQLTLTITGNLIDGRPFKGADCVIIKGSIPKRLSNDESSKYSTYTLTENYPNPFNPNTNIDFYIPEDGLVKLEIFNSLGEKVEVVIEQELSVGYYSSVWNAQDFPSGIYFYRIQAGSFVETKKMILMK